MKRPAVGGAVILLLAALVGVASAATWNVSSVEELRSAVAAAQPGDTVLMADGTYGFGDTTGCQIADKSDLTIRSASGNRGAVVLTGLGINSRKTEFGFKLYRSSRITIQDITIQNVYWHCIQVNEGSNYCTLRNLYMWDAGEGPVKVTSPGTAGPYSDYGLVEDCAIGYTTKGTRSVVEGIDIVASVGWVIRDCEFYNVTKGRKNAVAYGFFAKGNAQDTVVDGCYFEDCDIPLSFGGGGTGTDWFRDGDSTYEHRGGIMSNNVVNRTLDVAVYMNKAGGFKLYNNTLWSTYTGADSSVDVRFNSYGDVVNNLCSQGYQLRDGGTATFSHNIFHAPAALFVDQVGGDFHLVGTAAAAIDQGADTLASVPDDMDAQARPCGSGVDIGADEHCP